MDSQFFRMLLEEEGGDMRELLDAEEYLVPQPASAAREGPFRHPLHTVRNAPRGHHKRC